MDAVKCILGDMNVVLPAVVDPLGEALHFLRMSGIFYCRSEFTAPWALALPPMKAFLMLHVVTRPPGDAGLRSRESPTGCFSRAT